MTNFRVMATLCSAALVAGLLTAQPASAAIESPIVSALNGQCLDAHGNGAKVTPNGAPAIQWPCHGDTNQLWHFSQDFNRENTFRLQVGSGNSKCLDVPGKSSAAGAELHLWDCQSDSGGSQLWQFRHIRSENGWHYHYIQNIRSGKCLDIPGGSTRSGVQLIQWPCSLAARNQVWRNRA
ncbi:hypothetical protein BS330_37350 [Amycolatopsis keratiniphila subsp. nogabecina]|nr:hypothetical protein BS330_37350 [Amycolatopsis keratiniphila subsp. nogabecina]